MCNRMYPPKHIPKFIDRWKEEADWIEYSLDGECFAGEQTIQPTTIGLYMLALYYMAMSKMREFRYWLIPCKHKNWIDWSYGNPDSGGDGGYCEDCGFSFWHQYY